MPGSGFKHQAFHVKTLVRKTLDTPYEMVKRAMVSSQKFFWGRNLRNSMDAADGGNSSAFADGNPGRGSPCRRYPDGGA